MRIETWSWLVAGGVLAGCVADTEPGEDEVAQDIAIGTNDTSDPRSNAVVLIGDTCTGTLIAPNVVLTTAHCGWSDPSFATGDWTSIPPVLLSFGPVRGAPIAFAFADAVSVPPLAAFGPWLVDDIAVLRLTANVPQSIAVPRPVYVNRPFGLDSTTRITEIGFGGGRDRRYMGGSNYRDWTLPDDRLMNAFGYTPDVFGAGIGDRGTNIEQGDGGGPILIGGNLGYVIGVLSWWDPYGIATFGPGGEGRPSIQNWLELKAPQRPDYVVTAIAAAGCSGTHPAVRITVQNRGVHSGAPWLDVFHDLPAAPTVGTLSDTRGIFSVLVPGQSTDYFMYPPVASGPHWIDVIADSHRVEDEIDEGNNVTSRFLTFPVCPAP